MAREAVQIQIECRGLADALASRLQESVVTGLVFSESQMSSSGASSKVPESPHCLCLCLLRLPEGKTLPESYRVRIAPRIEGQMLLVPWHHLLPAHTTAFPLAIPLRPSPALAPWRAGRRAAPKPVDPSTVQKIELLFLPLRVQRFPNEGFKEEPDAAE